MNIVNTADINNLVGKDPAFSYIIDYCGIPPNWNRKPGFESLCRIILEQQVSLESANAHYLKLLNYIGELNPENILALNDAEMRECQISRQKAVYLKALAVSVIYNYTNFESLHLKSYSETKEILTAVKGIGDWTSDIYQIFCLQRKDIFPKGDIACINTAIELFDIKNNEELYIYSEKWSPNRTLAAFFLWHYYLSKRNRTVNYSD